jgi:ribonuclease P protein component
VRPEASPPARRRARFPLARHRLGRADFARVYAEGRRARGASFTAIVLPNGRDVTRLGLSVSKKHARRAVDRNRTRRILREAFRLSLAELPPGLDVVLVANAPGRAPALADARAALLALVARALARPPRGARPAPPPGGTP